MTKKYKIPDSVPLQVKELPPVTATSLKNRTADVLDHVAATGAVAITRHDKPRAVLLSLERYRELKGEDEDWLADMYEEYRGMLDRMQDPAQKEAAERLFEATPEELGAAAVRAASRKKGHPRE